MFRCYPVQVTGVYTGKKILICEDCKTVAISEAAELSQLGYTSVIVHSGEEAVERCSAGDIDLVLMDIDLGAGISGVEAARRILKKSDLPIVFLSSHTEKEFISQVEEVTSYGFIVKNSGIAVLDVSIKMAFRLFQAKNRERAEYEKRLKNEQSLSMAQKIAHIGSFECDPENNISRWSEELYHIFGIDPSEPSPSLEEKVSRFLHPDDAEDYRARCNEAILSRSVFELEYRIIRPDGTVRWLYDIGEPLGDGEYSALRYMGVTQDITERRQAEDSFQRVFHANPVPQLITRAENGQIYQANKAFCRATGFNHEVLAGKTARELKLWSDPSVQQEIVKRMQKGEGLHNLEMEFFNKAGDKKTLLSSFDPIEICNQKYSVFTGIDITDFKESEAQREAIQEKLRESEEIFRGIFDGSIGAIFLFNLKKEFVDSNQAGLDLLGYSREELLNMSIADVDIDPVVVLPAHAELLSGGRLINYEHSLRRKDNSVITVLNNSMPLTDAEGRVIGMLSTLIDISKRKEIEETLRKREEQLSQALQMAKAGAWELDLETDTFTFDDNFFRVYRTTAEEAGGYTMSSSEYTRRYVVPEDMWFVEKEIGAIMAAPDSDFTRQLEHRIRYADGEIGYVKVRTYIIKDASGRTVKAYGVNQDITELRQVEQELFIERNMFIAGPTMVFKWKNSSGWPVEYVSDNALYLLGYPVDRLVSGDISYTEMIHPDDLNRVLSEHDQLILDESGHFEHKPYRLRCADGRYIWVANYTNKLKDSTGQLTHYMGYLVDITKQRETDERLALALQGARAGLWDWHVPSGNIVIDERTAGIGGYDLSSLQPFRAKKLPGLFHHKDIKPSWHSISEHFSGKTDFFEYEIRMKKKSGGWIWTLFRGKVVERSPGGKPLRITGTTIDIDERKRAELKVQALLDEKEMLLKEVHHRIKNNVLTIKSFLRIQAHHSDDSHASEVLTEAEERLSSMMVLYDTIYRRDNFQDVMLNEYIEALVREIAGTFPGNVATRITIPSITIPARTAGTLGILIYELISNAMKHGLKHVEKAELSIEAESGDNKLILRVSDNGDGFDPDAVKSGFGLQLVDMLAAQLDGTFSVSSGNGTTCSLEMPV